MTDNIVMFPKAKRGIPPQSLEELKSNVENIRKEHVEFAIDEGVSALFGALYEEGFDLSSDELVKPTGLVIECVRSAMYAAIGLPHPLQSIAEAMYDAIEQGNTPDEQETPLIVE